MLGCWDRDGVMLNDWLAILADEISKRGQYF